MGKSGGVSYHHPETCATVATARDLFDTAIIKKCRDAVTIFDKHLGKFRPGPHGRAEGLS
jgi:hypothetical protein